MRFLLVKYSAIGDCVMGAWAATAIRERMPEAYIAWAVECRCADVVDDRRLVDLRYVVPRVRWKREGPLRNWRERILTHTRLRKERFDYGIDLQGHAKTAMLLRVANPRQRIASRAVDELARRLNPAIADPPAGTHMIERHLLALNRFGPFETPARPILPEDPGLAERLRRDLDPRRRLVTISVNAGQPEKAYPRERWLEVGRSLVERGWQVALLGGPKEPPLDVPPELTNWIGKLPLPATLEAVRMSTLHLASDTGTGHMAAALGVPGVSVFGPTDPAVYRPYSPQTIVLREGRTPADVSVASVLEAAERAYAPVSH
jgi:ADP-heptose:LPS heptosyltransferase